MKIGECFFLNPENNTNKYTDYINYIDTSSVTSGKLENVQYLDSDFPSRANRLIMKNDILYSSVRPNLKHYYFYKDEYPHCVGSTGFIILRKKANSKINEKFVYYYLSTNTICKHFSNIAELSQTTFPSISAKDIAKIGVPNFTFDQQQKIANILSRYDEAIENNSKRIKLLEQMAQSLYKEWFVRFRFPGWQNVEFENGMPKGWKYGKIGECGEIIGGGTPSTDTEEFWDGDIPWLTPADLSEFDYIYIKKGSHNITELGLKKSSAKLMPKNTVLLSSRAPVGYVAIAQNEISTNQGFKSVICNGKILNYAYLYYFFKLNTVALQNFATGATFPELSSSMLKRIKILIPKIELQNQFCDLVIPLFNEINILADKIANLSAQRDLLLPRLMSGKLEV